ncbi:unnamed protein product [Protopolystoma xenopodis]|uniref:Beta-catenin-like protein 1 N-terminal domain-containing protein n=1 Tax=Protopolystoma xenopodis TaxID=117903 RepID=A0A3S5CUQ5_9PLAT|nr:unnamed protein product [Protopolystoma xenopodis]
MIPSIRRWAWYILKCFAFIVVGIISELCHSPHQATNTSDTTILLQIGGEETSLRLSEMDGVDILLQQLAAYKRRDPTSPEEVELMHNLFNCLCTALLLPANKQRFLKGEGVQLMNLMLRLA